MIFRRIKGGLEPFNDEAYELMLKISNGDTVTFNKIITPRNYQFHKKYFALLKFSYENWEPGKLSGKKFEGVKPEKTFDRFRADLTILAGHFRQVIRVNGEMVIEPKSISFANMSEDEFEELYSNTINVVLKKILTNYDREQLDNVILELLNFS